MRYRIWYWNPYAQQHQKLFCEFSNEVEEKKRVLTSLGMYDFSVRDMG